MSSPIDAVVVGSGPNGLAAAVTLAEAGCSVLVLEAADRPGGGSRSAALTLPGFTHDVCSAIHPLGVASPFFRRAGLADHGLEWIHPDVPLAHPLDDGSAVLLEHSPELTAAGLEADEPSAAAPAAGFGVDADAYLRLVAPLARDAERLLEQLLGPVRLPRHPLAFARFAVLALRSARGVAGRFRGRRARALLAGLAGHSALPLDRPMSAAPGVLLGLLAHVSGWPLARGGSQAIVDALTGRLAALGGRIETGHRVTDVDALPPARAVLLDLSPREVLAVAGHRLTPRYGRALRRFRHAAGVFKVDYALDGPVPWSAESCLRAGTVHLGGTFEEIAAAERAAADGRVPERPFVLAAQQSLFDPTRAPDGQHTLWAYCRVPRGARVDMRGRVTAQVERFAPGFRDRVLAVHAEGPLEIEAANPNYVGGDISGGTMDLRQAVLRPTARRYRTPDPGIYLCSASTPPGAGVHGMCGWWAARSALRRLSRCGEAA